MPNWSGTVLTAKGRALQAKIEAGTVMNITKLKIGDGTLGAGQAVDTLNDLVAPKQIVDISALTPLESGVCKIHGVVTNDGLETGFYVRELGVFAQDPELGEILYAYTADGAPDFLPAAGGAVAVSEELVINLAFANAATITANIAMDGLITANILQQHNTNKDAHAEAFAQHNTSASAHADLLHLRQNITAYVVGDIAYSPNLPSYAYVECIQAGTTAATEPTWPATGEEITDGTVRWRVRDIKSGSGVSIGTITARLSLTPAPGELACDTGALVSRTTYKELWAWVQANAPLITEAEWQAQAAVQSSVGYYSSGDGATTFRLPRLVDFVRGSDGTRLPGTWQADAFQGFDPVAAVAFGRTKGSGAGLPYYNGAGGTTPAQMEWDATAINPDSLSLGRGYIVSDGVHGEPRIANETRPKSVAMLYCVKAFDAATNQGLIDITALANEMAGKVNLTDFTSWGDDTNGGRKFPDGRIEQWGTTAVSGTGIAVIFPIAFPVSIGFVGANVTATITSSTDAVECINQTLAGFVAACYSGAGTAKWFAIGR